MKNNKKELSLEEIENLHNTFIEIAAHKFLSPLTIINWNIELIMKNDELPEDVKAKLNDIDINVKKLKDLSNALIKISELSDDTHESARYEVEIGKLVKDVIHEYDELILSKNIEIKNNVEDSRIKCPLPENILKEVFRSIFENSILYNVEKGEIVIDSSITSADFIIEITDSGIGISNEELRIVPQMFYRAKNAKLSEVKGNGLSLYYSNLIIDKVDGKMELENIDKGLKVKVFLPKG